MHFGAFKKAKVLSRKNCRDTKRNQVIAQALVSAGATSSAARTVNAARPRGSRFTYGRYECLRRASNLAGIVVSIRIHRYSLLGSSITHFRPMMGFRGPPRNLDGHSGDLLGSSERRC